MSQIAIEPRPAPKSALSKISGQAHELLNELEDTASDFFDSSKTILDQAIDYAEDAGEFVKERCHKTAFDAQSWIESASSDIGDFEKNHGHHGHPHKPNLTVYELIAKSKYTTKLAALINEYDDLVELLNGTSTNFTVFAPTDYAFEKVPKHAPKPSKEDLKKLLTYHVSAEFYPAGRVLVSHTVPTLLAGEGIGGEPQRLSTNIGIKGLTVNFYSRIVAIDIFGTNGVIHGVSSILVPPPKAATVISLLPGEFSTLELGLEKTGLFEAINDTSNHVGGTIFAPSNFAFQKLGPKINAFLFSKYGKKYLKALLAYHVVANQTLYSDAYYKADAPAEVKDIPKGYFHVDLPTLLKGKSLSVDVARYGRLISMKINAFSDVTVEDGIVYDGVIQLVSNVLIPPKSVGDGIMQEWNGEELEVEDLKERLAVSEDDDEQDAVEEGEDEVYWKSDL